MTERQHSITIELLGKTQQFACPAGQEQALIDAAAYLNEQVAAMKQRATVRNDEKALLMAALHLSHELLEERRQRQELSARQQSLCEKLAASLSLPNGQDKTGDLP